MNRLNGVSAERVLAQTGRDWDGWIKFLDDSGAEALDHPTIVKLVQAECDKAWWSQMVTVGYEQAKGRRVKNQNVQGFQVSVSRTLDKPLGQVFAAWDRDLAAWYAGPSFVVTTHNLDKNIRGKFADGSVLAVGFYKTPSNKTQVALAQEKLTTATAAEAARKLWQAQLDRLAEFLA